MTPQTDRKYELVHTVEEPSKMAIWFRWIDTGHMISVDRYTGWKPIQLRHSSPEFQRVRMDSISMDLYGGSTVPTVSVASVRP